VRALFALTLASLLLAACGREPASPAEAPSVAQTRQPAPAASESLAVFGGGCFWCAEAVFLRLNGVLGVRSGYAGGDVAAPSYDDVCSGTTGHAEVIEVRFDPSKIAYEQLLRVFFATHDPTTKDRQGHDVGTQYRSIILTFDASQRETADRVIRALDAADAFPAPIVTEVMPLERFWPADAYHQDFYARNPRQGYCRAVVAPKVEKFEKAFESLLKR
jgi:peptide-methionine (S)-S-oxide reductase